MGFSGVSWTLPLYELALKLLSCPLIPKMIATLTASQLKNVQISQIHMVLQLWTFGLVQN